MKKKKIDRETQAKCIASGVILLASLGVLGIGKYQIPADESVAGTETASEAAGTAQAADSTGADSTGTADSGESVDLTAAYTSYTPGDYTASAAGLESSVTVVCTFDEDGLTAVSMDVSGETADVGALVGPDMSSAILNAGSADVDGVTGATVTSNAVKNAVAKCFAAAGTAEGTAEEGEEEAAEENAEEAAEDNAEENAQADAE